ncbi:MAG: bifunctional helix-turn-helix transcriptional regulator/GNAT family N-acetyltransferase [Bacteroidales bacterium]|nr:bifunctional helix-turn-helix transcriptional regulator/GNAT family N-acetyltransferase [Bacteroidales bacterium]
MNYIHELDKIAIGSRLKQLTELFMRDMVKVYKEFHVDFEPRWFTFIHLLSTHGEMSLKEVAVQLNQTHVAANQVANALEKKKLIKSSKDTADNRKRMVSLSSRGREIVELLEPVWNAVDKAVEDLMTDTRSNLFAEIVKIENALEEKSMYCRITERLNKNIISNVAITHYLPVHKHAFIDLNVAWLTTYFKVEPHDEILLFNPDEEIIGKGGKILVALYQAEVVGTIALLKVNDRVCELTKMAVREDLQHRGIGRKLLDAAMQLARDLGYRKLTLLTSPVLERAINLYRSYGFTESSQKSLLLGNLERSSIQFELNIHNQ